jgi:hypothetical protein
VYRNRHTQLVAAIPLALLAAAPALAEPVAFDLPGPVLQVEVSRDGKTLPVSQVPRLASGDRLWVKADLAADQSVHYLLVAVFLRGSTDPPPTKWFFRCETWGGKCRKDGMTLTVPDGAQQMVVFLAPETGGDFGTLEDTVRGRPGAFVRTSQELNQAAVEHLRLQTYLAEIRRLGDSDPEQLKDAAPLLSRTLAIKVDERCLQKSSALQAGCLTQGQEALILSDGHGESVTQQLTSGPASDLAMEAVNTPQLRAGYYGPFIGSLLDIARLLDSFHTAKYQYIPALGTPHGRELALTLNAPPSFHDPKSVLVAALPPIDQSQGPELRPVDSKEVYCLRRKPLVLALEGAPSMFAGSYAHDLTLRITGATGNTVELPATADAVHGGFAIDTSALGDANLGENVRGVLQGAWGFERYNGPSFSLTDADIGSWKLGTSDEAAPVVGREDIVHLVSGSVRCVSDVKLSGPAGEELNVEWKVVRSDELEIRLPLQAVGPGDMALRIDQYGSPPQRLMLHGYAAAAHLDGFEVHAGDDRGLLKGSRLDEVETLTLGGTQFTPATLSTSQGADELTMVETVDSVRLAFKPGDAARASVKLKDGRAYDVRVTVVAARPSATLISKSIQTAAAAGDHHIRLANQNELPLDAQLVFALQASAQSTFTRDEKIEVETADGSSVVLDQAGGGVRLQNTRIAMATLDPQAFGPSAFGPLRFRLVGPGVAGDWQPLATLVRLPVLKGLQCDDGAESACQLSGTNLFLIDSVSGDAQFHAPVVVPDGFTGYRLSVPRPAQGQLYVKLRDDPSVISVATLEVPKPQPAAADTPASAPPVPNPTAPAGATAAGPGPAAQDPAPAPSSPPSP